MIKIQQSKMAESPLDNEKAATLKIDRSLNFATFKKQVNCSKVNYFLGQHNLIDSSFLIGNSKFLIRKRKNPTSKKPLYFISQIKPKYQYITSLYPTSRLGVYSADFDGCMYLVSLSDSEILFFN